MIRRGWLRAAAIVITVALAWWGSATGVGTKNAVASCGGPLPVKFQGVFHYGVGRHESRVPRGRRIGTGYVYLDCGAVRPHAGPLRQPVRVFAAGGSSPAIAILRTDGELYLAGGYLSVLPSHPFYAARFGGGPAPDAERGERCSHRLHTVRGRVQRKPAPGGGLLLDRVRAPAGIPTEDGIVAGMDAKTVVHGLTRGGLPFLEKGTRVSVKVWRCAEEVLIARDIRPAIPPRS